MNILNILTIPLRWAGLLSKPQRSPKRICARCNQQIKRGHHWSAKAWVGDPRPRHWECENPTGAPPPPISTETLGFIESIPYLTTEQVADNMHGSSIRITESAS